MRKRKFRFGFAAMALLVILGSALTGCGIWHTSFDVHEASDPEAKNARRKILERLKIAPVELDVEKWEAGNYMVATIGSLRLFLPEGWKFEQRQEEGVNRYVLTDIHSQCESEEITGHKDGYEHEIVITPYEISQMPELSLQEQRSFHLFSDSSIPFPYDHELQMYRNLQPAPYHLQPKLL